MIQQRNMYKQNLVYVALIVPVRGMILRMLLACMYELVKVQQSTQHGKARQSTAKHKALRSAELKRISFLFYHIFVALRCATDLSCRARQGIAGHGTARRCAAELYIALRWGAGRDLS